MADQTADEKAIRIRRSEWPSDLDHIIHRTDPAAPRTPRNPGRQAANLAGHIRKLERENYLLTMLYDAGKALNARLSVVDISDQVLSLAFRIEGVERGFVMLFDESGQPVRQSQVRYRNPQTAENQPKFILSRSVQETIKKERQPILIDDLTADQRFRASESMKISGLRSAMCAPLAGADRLFGILYVDKMEKTAAFTHDAWTRPWWATPSTPLRA